MKYYLQISNIETQNIVSTWVWDGAIGNVAISMKYLFIIIICMVVCLAGTKIYLSQIK